MAISTGAAILGGAAIAGAAGLYSASKASKSQDRAIDAASDANANTLAAQMKMFYQQRADMQPFTGIGLEAIPKYQALLGINNQPLTAEEKGFLSRYAGVTDEYLAENPNRVFVDAQGRAVQTEAGAYSPWTLGPANVTRLQNLRRQQATLAVKPTELSPQGTWTLREATKMQNRQDAARGLAGSGGASARLGELAAQVHASDWASQYGRILDALKIGTGASAAAGGASQAASNAIGQAGATTGTLALASGQNQASYYSGLGGAIGQGLNTGLKAYQVMQPQAQPTLQQYDAWGTPLTSTGNYAFDP